MSTVSFTVNGSEMSYNVVTDMDDFHECLVDFIEEYAEWPSCEEELKMWLESFLGPKCIRLFSETWYDYTFERGQITFDMFMSISILVKFVEKWNSDNIGRKLGYHLGRKMK